MLKIKCDFLKKKREKWKLVYSDFWSIQSHDSEILHTIDNDVKLTEKRLEVADDKEK